MLPGRAARAAARARRSFSTGGGGFGGAVFTPRVLAALGAAGAASGAMLIYKRIEHAGDIAAMDALPLYEGNPIVFFDIIDGDKPLGRLVFQLRADAVPRTAENVRALATGALGWGYKGSPLHGADKGRRVYGGDFFGAGYGGYSIYGDTFADENFSVRHAGPGVLGMHAAAPNGNNSQFYVTLKRMPELDGRAVAVGQLLEGRAVLDALDKAAMSSGGRWAKGHDFRVAACGELKAWNPARARAPRPQAAAAAGGAAET